LISFLNAVLLFLVLHAMFPFKRRRGQVLFVFILLYGVSRFFLEYLRADEAAAYFLGLPTLLSALGMPDAAARLPGLTISQSVGLVLVAASAAVLAGLARSRRPELDANDSPPAPPATTGLPARPQRRKEKR
jgi:prolipoprotein diacylglyceryltransferase